MTTIELLINHVEQCQRFSIDTESRGNSKVAFLMQIHSIPVESPSFVILVQLNYLPMPTSELFDRIKFLLFLLFRRHNVIYAWGPSDNELEWVLSYDLFTLSVECEFVDLQKKFSYWFEALSTVCESCRSSSDTCVYLGAKNFCLCQDMVYREQHKLWSLQDAILCVSDSYLSKLETNSSWDLMIDPKYSTLPLDKLDKMIRYAIYDVFALTYLHKPVMELWTHEEIRKSSMIDLLFHQVTNNMNNQIHYENDEDDEEQRDESLLSVQTQSPLSMMNEELEISIDDQENVHYDSSHRKNFFRSEEARRYRNCRRNYRRRRLRYRFYLVRQCYSRFTIHRIRTILKQLHVAYTHIKIKDHNVIIGMKSQTSCDYYNERIKLDLFDRNHFFSITYHR